MHDSPTDPRDAYLVLDASGSTVARGLNDALNQALPHVVDAFAVIAAPDDRLAVVVSATRPATLLQLSRPDDVAVIPAVAAGGIAALAPALESVADSIVAERLRAESDEGSTGPVKPSVLFVCDGHPVDRSEELAAAVEALRARAPRVVFGVAVAGATMRTDLVSVADRLLDVSDFVGDPPGLGAELATALLR